MLSVVRVLRSSYLARGQRSIRFGRILFTIGRAAAAFSDSSMAKSSALHLPFGSALLGYVLRPIICLFRSPHTSSPSKPFPACVSPAARGAEYRRGCRCNSVRISGGKKSEESGRNDAFALCFRALLSAAPCTCTGLSTIPRLYRSASRASGASRCTYICVHKRGGECHNARKSGKARETVSTVSFTSPASGSYILQDNAKTREDSDEGLSLFGSIKQPLYVRRLFLFLLESGYGSFPKSRADPRKWTIVMKANDIEEYKTGLSLSQTGEFVGSLSLSTEI